ncbi:MAG: GIY-YIG nuclease family protein [Candidatus Shapirobacteria bacterium]|jgi:putative endonuclease
MSVYFTYVLFSEKDNRLYIGYSTDLKKRIKRHFDGKVTATKNRRPLKLIHYEVFLDIKDAKSREIYLKSGEGRKQLKNSIHNTLEKLNYKFL